MFFLTLSLLLIATSCKNQATMVSQFKEVSNAKVDSVNTFVRQEQKVVTTERASSEIDLKVYEIVNLPVGASFSNKDKNSEVKLTKKSDGLVTVTSNCDSLNFIIESQTLIVERLQKENKQLQENKSENKERIVYKTTRLQDMEIACCWIFFS